MKFKKITPIEIEESLVHLRQLVFEVTDVCNLKCRYCRYGNAGFRSSEPGAGQLTFSRARLMIDYLAALWEYKAPSARVETEIGFTGGEPLLNMPLISRLIEYVESLHLRRKITYVINTNALLLDQYAGYLAAKNVDLRISLDGDETAHSYRTDVDGSNSYEKVLNRIKELQQQYPGYFAEHVRFQAVLHNRNSVPGVTSFILREFNAKPIFVPLHDTGIRKEKKEAFVHYYRNTTAETFPASCPEPFATKKQMKYAVSGTCSPFSKRMFVTTAGQILPCDKIESHFLLGQLTEKSVILDLEVIADKVNAYLNKLKKQCSVCGNNRYCTLCFYQMADINDACPVCPGFLKAGIFSIYRLPDKNRLAEEN